MEKKQYIPNLLQIILREKERNISFILCISLLCYVGFIKILVFHTLIELLSAVIAISTLIIAINSHSIIQNQFFIFLGIAFGFVGLFDTLHAFAYIGASFYNLDINDAGQYWLIGRCILCLSLLAAYRLFTVTKEKFRHHTVFIIYLIISSILIFFIASSFFPDCYKAEHGPTLFKKVSELCFTGILSYTSILFLKVRRNMDKEVYQFMQLFLLLSIVTEFTAAFFAQPKGPIFIFIHICKLTSFLFLYQGIVATGIKNPYKLLFRQYHDAEIRAQEKEYELLATNRKLAEEYGMRKQLEELIMQNEECYKLLVEHSQDAIFIHSRGHILWTNTAAVQLTGFSIKDELKGKHMLDFILTADHAKFDLRYQEMYNSMSSVPPTETQLIRSNGDKVYVEVVGTFFKFKGDPTILSIIRDITSKKHAEVLTRDIEEKVKLLDETREHSKKLTEFFTNISHELRTPLNVLMASVQVLQVIMESPTEKEAEYLKIMKQNCYRLLRLINNILDLSKLDAGFLELHCQNLNIVSVIEEITISVAQYVQDKGARLIFDTDIEEKVMAFDPDKIERIMLNLLSNAVKHTNPGDEIQVYISDADDAVDIYVKDTGMGIPEDKQEEIFNRFRQADMSLRRKSEGSGIGLSLVKSLVELHSGIITLHSELGKGSEFKIHLPVKKLEGAVIPMTHELMAQENTERIHIEFSDIYTL